MKSLVLSVAVVIPTRNRQDLVISLLTNLNSLDSSPNQIIIIDSSDNDNLSRLIADFNGVIYRHVKVKSAAIQRNIGLLLIDETTKYVCFLDDDVIVPSDYLSKLIEGLETKNAIGISGLAINEGLPPRKHPTGFVGLVHRIFLLDSNRDGALLKSAINIPVRNSHQGLKTVDWLIGCSIWKREKIGNITFENSLMGQSLGEDVIFSHHASKLGDLIVDSDVILNHLESPVSRPTELDFWKMWIMNRRLLIKYMGNSWIGRVAFYWANIGQLVILIISTIRNPSKGWGAPRGIFAGLVRIAVMHK